MLGYYQKEVLQNKAPEEHGAKSKIISIPLSPAGCVIFDHDNETITSWIS